MLNSHKEKAPGRLGGGAPGAESRLGGERGSGVRETRAKLDARRFAFRSAVFVVCARQLVWSIDTN